MIRSLRCLLLSFALASPLIHAQEQTPAALDSAQRTKALLDAELVGVVILRHDHAAAVATDAARELKAFRRDARLGGWITEAHDGGIAVTFISKDAAPQALYRILVSDEGKMVGDVQALPSPTALTPNEAAAASARNTAFGSDFAACSRTYNTVVLPAPENSDAGWTVYLLPGTTKQGHVPIGGSYRFDLDASGTKVIRHRGFTRTCIALENPKQAEAMMITHLLDTVPTEIHVYWSLWARKPMYVMTSPGSIWKIEDGRIMHIEHEKDGE